MEVLERIEARLGERYPWLRRSRAKASRLHRLTLWRPLSLGVVNELLGARERRLLRSGDDVVEGIIAAVEGYATSLGEDGADAAEDLWNTPSNAKPSPKDEEHATRKICGVIRRYFENYAVAADREVEIHRRALPRDAGGEPGSEVDTLVQVPARGAVQGQAIRVPIEVKLSSNASVKSAMRDQLVERYIPQLGASDGVYVVVWMDVPDRADLEEWHNPNWESLETARAELEDQAAELGGEHLNLRALVLDASLR